MFKKDSAVKAPEPVKEPEVAKVSETVIEGDKESTVSLGEQVQETGDNFEASAIKLEELRAGRGESDIPLNDAYWEYRNSHTLTHGKHAIRVDETQLVKGKPVDKSKLASEE